MNKDVELSDELEEQKADDKKTINLEKPQGEEKPQGKHGPSKKLSFSKKCNMDYLLSYETNKELNVLDR